MKTALTKDNLLVLIKYNGKFDKGTTSDIIIESFELKDTKETRKRIRELVMQLKEENRIYTASLIGGGALAKTVFSIVGENPRVEILDDSTLIFKHRQ